MRPTTILQGARSVWKASHEFNFCPSSVANFLDPWHSRATPLRPVLTTVKHRLPIVRPKAGERAPPIKTQARGATILPNFVGLIFQVHNGKIYNDVRITEDMVGHKLGEFSACVHLDRRKCLDPC
ncbi:hypothetical protein E4T44_09007 [Aureobasidium sp. EXF-8845]|nr:hypothetical protein E4T44_09007 [Aureobasidium sp. EXF-8845]KAI4842727.1 hypothetical protein E4T45_08936 [Aureobasidium sp. EXF-8846]